MIYDALTIDTQTVYSNDRNLDRGLVGQLDQYKDGLIKVIISEVTLRELHKMLVEKAKAPREALTKAMRDGAHNGQLTSAQHASLESVLNKMAPPEEHAKQQLREFIGRTGADVITADQAPMNALLDGYFKSKPPFSGKGKKSEFPDAIALLSLEAWAAKHRKRVLVVSKDNDWKTFSYQSPYLDLVDDLGKAMAMLSELAQATEPKARSVLTELLNEGSEKNSEIEYAIANAIDLETPQILFESSMPSQDDGCTLSLMKYSIDGLSDQTTPIDIVRVSEEKFTFRVPVNVYADLSADIDFFVFDNEEDSYLPMGSTFVEREIEFHAYLLIGCAENVIEDNKGEKKTAFVLEELQLIGVPKTIDIGYVDYSLSDEEDYYLETEDWAVDELDRDASRAEK